MAQDDGYEMKQTGPGSGTTAKYGPGATVDAEDMTSVVLEQTPFERYITLNPAIAFGLSLQISWETIALTFPAVLQNGGPASLVYGLLITVIGGLAVAASLGEMAAVDPAVGAQYRWAARYAPTNLRPHFWGFMQGWLTWAAWITACAATPFLTGSMIQAMAIYNYPSYPASQTLFDLRWQVTLIAWAATVIVIVWNLFARKILVLVELGAGLLHLSLFLAVIVTLAALARPNSSSFVWDTVYSDVPVLVAPAHGWVSPGVAFCVGLLPATTAAVGFDGLIHMSGEAKHAPRTIPHGMIACVLINGVLAFAFSITLLYTCDDPAIISDPSYGTPFIGVLALATKSRAGTNAIFGLMAVVYIISGFTIFASVSRLTWAFARDGGLPFPEFFSRVDPRTQIPINALCLVAVLCMLLHMINIGSTVALNAIISLAIVALFVSYLIPITFLIMRKIKGERPRGPFQLGAAGLAINIFALAYLIFIIIWVPFPVTIPVTKESFNYAGPVWFAFFFLALIDYALRGKTHFKLPAYEIRHD